VLVTRALGYIGSRLVPYLTEIEYDCIGYDTGSFRLVAWSFEKEIMEQQSEYRRRGGRFILPGPQVQIV
jgi:nucleoside-diphosphate-sugar epimerase